MNRSRSFKTGCCSFGIESSSGGQSYESSLKLHEYWDLAMHYPQQSLT